ncbi:MAG: Heterocyst differentiation ATP-binding protein HepA [Chroococcopsis gigantea SAG 12.99]|jgi:ATP-binding cassette subfamily B protein|nr:ABC transporter ATP-binding protein [Chlorogloea purpurea SAG 13.99]MDV2999833.1 Heterocyst differentiation ATP-binding protein HepA [Chroococcopsis gigantea SAG 12.99]
MVSFKDILGYYRDYRRVAIFSIITSSLLELVDLIVPYSVGQILNVLSNQPLDKPILFLAGAISQITSLPKGNFLILGILLTLILLTTVVKAPVQPWLSGWFHWEISLKARRDHMNKIIAKILTLPLSFYDENNPGRIANRIAKGIENHTWTYPEVAGILIPKLVRVLGIFVIIWVIEWWIAVAFLMSFVLILFFSLRDLKNLMSKERILDKHMENTQSRTSEIITNIKTVKAFATEGSELAHQRQRLEREYNYVVYRIHRGYVDLVTWQKTLVQGSLFTVFVVTLISTFNGDISIGHFITTYTLASMAYAELDPLSQIAELFARRYASMVRLQEFIDFPTGDDAGSLSPDHTQNNTYGFTGKIQLSGVSFGYDASRLVLKDINLLIEPYQTVALVGRSGSGKSTLVKLLFRYFEPTTGKILIDGEDINNLDVTWYRKRLAIVHQEVDIFNGTVLDNLTYGNPKVSFEKVQEACHIARVEEFIGDLPHGYYTIVGERGVRLSGGQRQRLGIARALIADPDVLIFDEATSSLDYESERSIQLAMKSILGTRTTIIIAHRLSTVREADKIVVLDKGNIVEVGSHEQLLSREGIYQRLHALQETGELLN